MAEPFTARVLTLFPEAFPGTLGLGLTGRALQDGFEAMGLVLHADAEYRLPVLTTVRIPEGVNDAEVRGALLKRHGIEIGGGLGELRGKVWRVGLMGHGARPEIVDRALAALKKVTGT